MVKNRQFTVIIRQLTILKLVIQTPIEILIAS